MNANTAYQDASRKHYERGKREGMRMALRAIRKAVLDDEEWGDMATHDQLRLIEEAVDAKLSQT